MIRLKVCTTLQSRSNLCSSSKLGNSTHAWPHKMTIGPLDHDLSLLRKTKSYNLIYLLDNSIAVWSWWNSSPPTLLHILSMIHHLGGRFFLIFKCFAIIVSNSIVEQEKPSFLWPLSSYLFGNGCVWFNWDSRQKQMFYLDSDLICFHDFRVWTPHVKSGRFIWL